MIRLVLLAATLAMLTLRLAHAAVVTVRTGQHDGFVRVVLTLPPTSGWDFGRTDDGYAFRGRAAGLRYDLSTVYDRIPRDRLSAIWADPETGALRLGLGCDCHAIATPFRPGIVVIDIADGPAPAGSPFEAQLEGAGGTIERLGQPRPRRPLRRPGDFVDLPPLPEPRLADEAAIPLPRMPDTRAVAMRDRLLKDLSQAVAAGTVQPAGRLPRRDAGPVVLPPAGTPPAAGQSAQLQDRILTHSPLDRRPTVGAGPEPCVAPERLGVADWAGGRHPLDDLAAARSDLTGEFDRPERDRIIAGARTLLYYGFGAEAVATLSALQPQDPETPVLAALGRVMDGHPGTGAFTAMTDCDGPAALWSLLEDEASGPATPLHREAILRSFSELPPGLRRHLAPGLADRLIRRGDAAAAQTVRDAIARLPGTGGTELPMIESRLARAEGRIEEAEARLEAVIAESGSLAPAALADLVNSRIARGVVPDPDTVLVLETMVTQHRGTAEEQALQIALARAQVMTGQADKAFDGPTRSDPMLWQLAVTHADAGQFAALATGGAARDAAGLSDGTRNAIAARLVSLGFPAEGLAWTDGLQGPDADLVRAQAALRQQDGRAALRALAGQDGSRAQALRGAAHAMLGDWVAAETAWHLADEPEAAGRARLLRRDWEALAMAPDPAIGGLARTLAGNPQPAEGTTPLAAARDLLSDSRATRDHAASVLGRFPAP